MPSVRQLSAALGYASPRSAALILEALVAEGRLVRRANGRLGLLENEPSLPGTVSTVAVPILGSAPCGMPMFVQENVEGEIRVDRRLARPPHRYFAVHASGDSMDQAGIVDGDLVLVRSCGDAADGERVVALVDGEVTIKVLRRGLGVAVLEPRSSNGRHRAIYATCDLEIQGVVVNTLT